MLLCRCARLYIYQLSSYGLGVRMGPSEGLKSVNLSMFIVIVYSFYLNSEYRDYIIIVLNITNKVIAFVSRNNKPVSR